MQPEFFMIGTMTSNIVDSEVHTAPSIALGGTYAASSIQVPLPSMPLPAQPAIDHGAAALLLPSCTQSPPLGQWQRHWHQSSAEHLQWTMRNPPPWYEIDDEQLLPSSPAATDHGAAVAFQPSSASPAAEPGHSALCSSSWHSMPSDFVDTVLTVPSVALSGTESASGIQLPSSTGSWLHASQESEDIICKFHQTQPRRKGRREGGREGTGKRGRLGGGERESVLEAGPRPPGREVGIQSVQHC